jgi:hypothetical protein
MTTQHGHEGRHHGRGTPECPTNLHHHHDARCVSPFDDRRQRAREAFDDAMTPLPQDVVAHPTLEREGWAERLLRARETAIETATRVQITDEVLHALLGTPGTIDGLAAAFRAAGFEVVE